MRRSLKQKKQKIRRKGATAKSTAFSKKLKSLKKRNVLARVKKFRLQQNMLLPRPKTFPKSLLNRLTLVSLVKHYVHLGQKKNQTHQEFRPLLLGFYNNISYINITLLSYYLRRTFRFLISLLIRNYRLCIVSQELAPYLASHSVWRNYYLVLDHWIPGTVSNYTILSKQKVRKAKKFLKRFPQLLITLKLEPTKVYAINNEARKLGMPLVAFLDSDLSPAYFNYFIPMNVKNIRSFRYCVFLLSSLMRRVMLIKKRRFIKKRLKCS